MQYTESGKLIYDIEAKDFMKFALDTKPPADEIGKVFSFMLISHVHFKCSYEVSKCICPLSWEQSIEPIA